MNKTFLKIIAGAALGILLAVLSMQSWVSAQNKIDKPTKTENSGGKFVGVWDVKATLRNCQTGAAIQGFRSLLTFETGGTMQETTSGGAPNLRSSGHGVWKHLGGNRFSNAFKFFRFSLDGKYDGWHKVRQQIDLSDSGNEFTATATTEMFDAGDKLIQTGCAAATAVRFE